MAATAKLFKHGRSQAVRLPKEFRLPGKEVRVSRMGKGVLLEPIETDIDIRQWFAELDALREIAGEFMPEGRQQPPMPPPEDIFRRMICLDTNAVIALINATSTRLRDATSKSRQLQGEASGASGSGIVRTLVWGKEKRASRQENADIIRRFGTGPSRSSSISSLTMRARPAPSGPISSAGEPRSARTTS